MCWVSKGGQEEPEVLKRGAYISILSLAYISETPTVLAALKAAKAGISQKKIVTGLVDLLSVYYGVCCLLESRNSGMWESAPTGMGRPLCPLPDVRLFHTLPPS